MKQETQEKSVVQPPEPEGCEPVVHPLVPEPGPLPDELERLGDELERAARSSLRRRNRRGQFIQSLGIILLAVPAALGFLSTDVAPSEVTPPAASAAPSVSPSREFSVAYIPDEPALSAAPRSCLDGRDCLSAPETDDTVTALEEKL